MAYPQTSFVHTQLLPGSLIKNRRDAAASNTLVYQLNVLKQTGRYDAFKLQWHPSYGDAPDVWPVPNHLFWDSDVAKWLEGACYFLAQEKNSDIEAAVDELVSMIASAQQDDGYLNIHYSVVEPKKRFTNLRDMHELYNAGHLIEAALAHNDLYRNRKLLDPILAYVDLLYKTFGPDASQKHGYPGHPEIELALLRLYDRTKSEKHLALAKYFILERGNPEGVDGQNYFDAEAKARGDDPNRRPQYYPTRDCLWYYQAHQPLTEQKTVEGHAVRAMYLLTAAADLVRLDSDEDLEELGHAVDRLWQNMVREKMYVTGGIGAIKQWEGFGLPYFLPQSTDEGGCYSETCASIGVMMLAERRLRTLLKGHWADIMELCLYNVILGAMSSDGTKFTYHNQLASSDGQDLCTREQWFKCACCPPNVLRLLAQIGGYIWTFQQDDKRNAAQINVHLFINSSLDFHVGQTPVKLQQETNWPWEGEVKFTLETSLKDVIVRLRIPGWAKTWKISPPLDEAQLEDGYLSLQSEWLALHPTFTILIPLEAHLISPHPFTNQDTCTVARGPIIYCCEDADNPWVQDHFKSVQLDPECEIEETRKFDSHSGDHYIGLSAFAGAAFMDSENVSASPSTPTKTVTSITRAGQVVRRLNRFASALSNYRTTLSHGGQFIFLIHDLWGADGSQNSTAPYPGDNGNWAFWDQYLNQLISDMKANGMTTSLIIDIWNEPDLSIFWNRSQTQYLQMWGRTYYKFRLPARHLQVEAESNRSAFGTGVLLSGPASANEPLLSSSWFQNWASYVAQNGSVPDQISNIEQYAWHMEGGGGDLLSAYGGLVATQKKYGLPSKPVNINEYATFPEQVPAGSAWWISQLERINAHGLRGNWLSGYQLHDFLASLLYKPNPSSPTATGYYPNGDYQVYKYYAQSMTGHRVGTLPSGDLKLDSYATVGDKVRILVGARITSGTWNLQVNGLTSVGLPSSGTLNIDTYAFRAGSNVHNTEVDAPTFLNTVGHSYSGGSVTFPIYQTDTTTAYTFEFNVG
ncbi:MAG: hypothetical protein Q9227_001864 [Pyrenula ochraceoflavens]